MTPINKELKERISFEKVVATWLKDEWHYSFYDKYRELVTKDIITDPDLSNTKDNEYRLKLLKANRSGIIDELPKQIEWYIVDFRKEDVYRTFLIPMTNGWVAKATNGSCKLTDCLNKNNWSPYAKEHLNKIEEIESRLNEEMISDKLIFIASDINSSFTCIEGNHRLVAFTSNALNNGDSDVIIDEIYLGISPSVKDCALYAEKYFSVK